MFLGLRNIVFSGFLKTLYFLVSLTVLVSLTGTPPRGGGGVLEIKRNLAYSRKIKRNVALWVPRFI